MDKQKFDSLSLMISDYLCNKELSTPKNNNLYSVMIKMLRCIEIEKNNADNYAWITDNYYLFVREGENLKRFFKAKKHFITLKEEETPVLLSIFLKAYSTGHTCINTETIETIISEIQKYVYLENEEFNSLVPFLKLSMVYTFLNAIRNGSQKEARYAVEGMRFVDEIDLERLILKFSETERLFMSEKSAVYPKMDEESKAYYRRKLSLLAKNKGQSEYETASEVLKNSKSRHIGFNLLDNKVFKRKRERLKQGYFTVMFLSLFIIGLSAARLSGNLLVGFFSVIALYGAVKILLDRIFLSLTETEYVPGIDLKNVLSKGQETVCVISILLDGSFDPKKIKTHLENEYTKAPKGEMFFALLCDLPESNRRESEQDKELIEEAGNIVNELNEQLENKFTLIVRRRSYSDTMKCYIGKNRKRGAIGELCGYICGEKTRFFSTEGNIENLKKCKLMILLDSDTQMTLGCAKRLISAALHPYNAPVIENGRVIRGYGIITPSISLKPKDTAKNVFTLLFSHEKALSHYRAVKRDISNDLYKNANFCGKGIVNISAFHNITKDFFKDEEVLSHDILEGIVLKTSCASDAVVLDGFPKSINGYLKRSERWIRGDFQNVLFLMDKIKNRFYEEIANPFTNYDKFRIFENCIRSFQTPSTIILFLIAFFSYGSKAKVIFIIGLISVLFSRVFCLLIRLYHQRTGAIPEVVRQILLGVSELILLPVTALAELKASFFGLYRILFSKKNMLQWQTAAKGDSQAVSILKFCAPSLFLAGFFILSWKGYFKALAMLFLLSPILCLLLKKELNDTKPVLKKEEKYHLLKEGEKIWNYFSDLVTQKENYLPPDNLSVSPKYIITHRTSPTNIGLYLVSVCSAYKLGFITEREMLCRIEKSLSTVEKMEKYKGHLYNWYNTENLKALCPRYVSLVDSGNFICSLIAVRGEINDANLSEKIDKIINSTDFEFLYDKTKKLFYIGKNIDANESLRHHYDILMSEARMTSYMAIAKGIVDKEHWIHLERSYSKKGLFVGPLSWTGTAFEYFMPFLFMPVHKNTLMHKAFRYAVFHQQKKAKKNSTPIGTSESGFYAFDNTMNYQYKAHGVGALGIKSGLDEENVVSPYSTYLMMPFSFKVMYKNFIGMKKYDFSGDYGLYEAIDCTQKRIGDSPYKVVKSYMSHHMGMSLGAICNLLCDFTLQKSFMKDREMLSAEELLYEKPSEETLIIASSNDEELTERQGALVNGRNSKSESLEKKSLDRKATKYILRDRKELSAKYIKTPFSS